MTDDNLPNGSVEPRPMVAQDDIVAKLRLTANLIVASSSTRAESIADPSHLREAADEIERLRAAIKSLLVNIDDDHVNVGKYGLCITCDVADGSWPCVHRIVLDELKEAVRDE